MKLHGVLAPSVVQKIKPIISRKGDLDFQLTQTSH